MVARDAGVAAWIDQRRVVADRTERDASVLRSRNGAMCTVAHILQDDAVLQFDIMTLVRAIGDRLAVFPCLSVVVAVCVQ